MVIEAIRPLRGPWLKADGWGDQIRWRVPEQTGTAYDAALALLADRKGKGGPHPSVPGLVGTEQVLVDITKDGDKKAYIFDVTYGRPDPTQDPSQNSANPLDWAPRYRLRYGFYQVKADQDWDHNPVVNSAGDPFDPPETAENLAIFLSATLYQESFSLDAALELMDAVNGAPVTICGHEFGAGCLLCRNYAPADEFTKLATPLKIAFEFECRFENFDRKILDRGFQSWHGKYETGVGATTNVGKLVMKGTTNPPAQAVLLNGAGRPLLSGLTAGHTLNAYAVTGPTFQYFCDAPEDKLPEYVRGGIITLTSGATVLPYQFKKTADFSFFSELGL